MVQIIQVNESDLPQVAKLFDSYRMFYNQPSNINAATIFLQERIEKKGTYNYFQCEVNPEIFDALKYRISSTFKTTNESEDIVDATRYQLVYTVYNKSDTIRFYKQHLDDEQKKIIEKIISLKIHKFKSIEYHSFPNELLTYKLPIPPSL